MIEFINELCRLTKVSTGYANAAYFTLSDRDRERPVTAAARYAKKLNN